MPDVIPITAKTLNIFEPTMFPTEMSVSFLKAAITDAVNSGTLVPKATMVMDIKRSLIPIEAAKEEAPFTKSLAPKANPAEARTT